MLRVVRLVFTLSAAAAGVCHGGILSPVSEKVTLRLRLAKGMKFSYVTTNQMKQSMGNTNSSSTSTTSSTYKVVSSSAHGVTIHITLDEIKINSPGNPAAAGMADKLKGTAFDAAYDDLGRPQSVKGQGSAYASMIAGASGSVGFLGLEFPNGAVGRGSTWTASLDIAKMIGA